MDQNQNKHSQSESHYTIIDNMYNNYDGSLNLRLIVQYIGTSNEEYMCFMVHAVTARR